jgi:transposase
VTSVHLSETCDEDAPHLIVHTETTTAPTPDWRMTEPIHRALAAQECLPRTHVVDGGDVDADARVSSRATHAIELLGPVPLENSWQAKAAQGFDLPHFHINWEEHTVTCPTGKQSCAWTLGKDGFEQDAISVRFAPAACRICPCRADCTHAKGGSRSLTFRPQQLYLALQAARARQTTDECREQYAVRAGIEGTLSQALRVSDLRQARYRGQAKPIPTEYPAGINCTSHRHG